MNKDTTGGSPPKQKAPFLSGSWAEAILLVMVIILAVLAVAFQRRAELEIEQSKAYRAIAETNQVTAYERSLAISNRMVSRLEAMKMLNAPTNMAVTPTTNENKTQQ